MTSEQPPHPSHSPASLHGTIYVWPDRWVVRGQLMANRPHRHVSASLLLGLDGAFELEVDGERRQTSAALVAPDARQALDPVGTRMLVMQLDPDSPAWRRLVTALHGRDTVDLPLAPGLTDALASAADCQAMAAALERLLGATTTEEAPLDPRVARICAHLRDTLPERLDAGALAENAGISVSRLTHLFREQTGVPLRRFLLHLKITRAVARWHPGMTLSALAAEAGFYDQPHLIRTAREMFDALPSIYISAGQFDICRCAPHLQESLR
ncbi:helix-turn-helix domain-containing protein [Alcanivorax limicola]|uniref:helix-turn-helix domain-containing protein n=1 Tax=Alcanivorax limicola TaxID=2874102 RepID=UPI001CBD1E4F|nr:helix-turn-helix domain-containing protein [Alcanivorax limicola]